MLTSGSVSIENDTERTANPTGDGAGINPGTRVCACFTSAPRLFADSKLCRTMPLFLDDVRIRNFTSCFKDKKFLAFFFKHLKKNNTDRYMDDFPFLSICGVERNFVRCDDLPVVFTKVIQKQNAETGAEEDWFSYAHADNLLMVPFEPQRLFMNVNTGRVYHPALEKAGGIGLVRSNLAIEFSASFSFRNGEQNPPTHFTWKDKRYELDTTWFKDKLTGS
ncbi:hypothetical protein X777_00381 [Ooceraea biroi]|uniref:Uncharacterized protein n=1 Tax=Ooceraea biroi TaxID=2015173 RepID=A0A026WU69_OOCBI|nr:hypothetical protein X777_00381 [Ooceraea biroi]